jgi:hypothetical protein
MDRCADALYDLARTKKLNLDTDNIELVVQPVSGNQPGSCQYYLVDHVTRTLFWLHAYDQATNSVFDDIEGVCDPSHIRTLL